jgi:hypothetical protein
MNLYTLFLEEFEAFIFGRKFCKTGSIKLGQSDQKLKKGRKNWQKIAAEKIPIFCRNGFIKSIPEGFGR